MLFTFQIILAGFISCISAEWINEYDRELYFTCPRQDQTLSIFESIHHDRKEDRMYSFSCKDVTTNSDSLGTPVCEWARKLLTTGHI